MQALLPYLPYMATGLAMTVAVSAVAFAAAVATGFLVALGRLFGGAGLRRALSLYVLVFRSVPELLVILFVYYSFDAGLTALGRGLGLGRLSFDPFVAVTIAIALQFGAYASEIFRDAHASLARGLTEAGYAIGLSTSQIARRILTPLMLQAAMPSLGNLSLVVLKVSALASVIGLEEITRRAKLVAGTTHEPLAAYAIASICFLGLTALVMVAQGRLERVARWART